MSGLLYDHLYQHLVRADQELAAFINGALVFDTTNVYDLFTSKEWDRERQRAIPKRPPAPLVSAEWTRVMQLREGGELRLRYGLLVVQTVPELGKPALDANGNPHLTSRGEPFEQLSNDFANCDEYYRCWSFVKPLSGPKNLQLPLGNLFAAERSMLVALRDNSEYFSPEIGVDPYAAASMFKLPVFPLDERWETICSAWPAFMAFALLHCKNVSTEVVQPEPPKPRHVRQGLPPKKAYHVLRLELPATLRPRVTTEAEQESERKMRFHLCRGHFKNLRHERFKAKGWHWWPAHWRGSKELGEVHKSYELRAGTNGNDHET